MAASNSASAALIDFGDFTYDSIQQLDWLDLTETLGETVDVAVSSNPGWRLATNNEVEGMFAQAFPGYVANRSDGQDIAGFNPDRADEYPSPYPELRAEAAEFRRLFGGFDWDDEFYDEYVSVGLYRDEDFEWKPLGVSGITFISDSVVIIERLEVLGLDVDAPMQFYAETSNTFFGLFLVRSTVVPVPGAIWLFFSALVGLGVLRRAKG